MGVGRRLCAKITTTGDVSLTANASFNTHVKTEGVQAGGLAVGASFASITLAPDVEAKLGDKDNVTAANLILFAGTPLISDYDALAETTGSVGALVGVNSTNSTTHDNATVKALIGATAKISH